MWQNQPRWFISYRDEIGGTLLGTLFLFVFFSCISFNPYDPSFFYFTAGPHSITNWCGVIGAETAALLFYLFGTGAYLFLLLLLAPALMLLAKLSFRAEWERLVSLAGILCASVVLFRIYGFDLTGSLPGGVLGYYGARFLTTKVSLFGAKVALWALFTISFIGATKISYTRIAWHGMQIALYLGSVVFHYSYFLLLYFAGKAHVLMLFLCRGLHASYGIMRGWLLYYLYPENQVWHSADDLAQREEEKEESTFSGSAERSDETLSEFFIDKDEKNHEKKIVTQAQSLFFTQSRSILWLRNGVLSFDITDKIKTFFTQQQNEKKKTPVTTNYKLPDLSMFMNHISEEDAMLEISEESKERGKRLEEKLECFGVKGFVHQILPGPVITLFEYRPEIDTKISKIVALEDDLALALRALSIRIVAPIPGKNVVGFEIANKTRNNVFLADTIKGKAFKEFSGLLPLILGVSSTGSPIVIDLIKAPHLLIAGSTGSGKSVGLNAMLFSLLCKLSPDELKLILVDPKRLEFATYEDIPHLLFPIVTNPRKAGPVLKWVVQEMERRYDLMARSGVRNIGDYQKSHKEGTLKNQDSEEYPALPFIVVMIDELADLMMVAGKEVEMHIARIAQMARAAGIHMIVATQRPSVDVLTGVIKVNFPSRIAYRVSSKIDSRTILDQSGAEKLLGRGDMLYMNASATELMRVHGSYISDEELQKLTNYLRSLARPNYIDLDDLVRAQKSADSRNEDDDLYEEVREFIKTLDEISISLLQRHFRIGFNRSARIIEMLEGDGLIAPAQGSKPRKILRD